MNANEITARVNELRAQLEMKPIKKWSGSRADGVAHIATLEARLAPTKSKGPRKSSRIVPIAARLNIDPKIARAKLRRLTADYNALSDVEIEDALKGDRRRVAAA